jgi:hypothetical protein
LLQLDGEGGQFWQCQRLLATLLFLRIGGGQNLVGFSQQLEHRQDAG